MANDSLLNAQNINAQLSNITSTLISELEIFPFIDSTNNYLMARAQTDTKSGCVCFAETQTAGKGRRGREWISPQGQNIYGSFLWRFQNAQALNGLSLAIGVGVIRALNKLEIFHVDLKWPNDIYSDGKKLGGILIEVTTHSTGIVSAVIGLGLNVSLPQNIEGITQAYTDLNTITEVELNRNQLVAELLNELLPIAATFEKQGFSAYLNEWRDYDYLFEKSVTLFIGSQKINGIVQGIDENGLLKLQREDGTIQTFASGEVSFSA
jgi:BirA family biotin operon repressor/biotin-[acetyl-CoA-carboxylase] ligase